MALQDFQNTDLASIWAQMTDGIIKSIYEEQLEIFNAVSNINDAVGQKVSYSHSVLSTAINVDANVTTLIATYGNPTSLQFSYTGIVATPILIVAVYYS